MDAQIQFCCFSNSKISMRIKESQMRFFVFSINIYLNFNILGSITFFFFWAFCLNWIPVETFEKRKKRKSFDLMIASALSEEAVSIGSRTSGSNTSSRIWGNSSYSLDSNGKKWSSPENNQMRINISVPAYVCTKVQCHDPRDKKLIYSLSRKILSPEGQPVGGVHVKKASKSCALTLVWLA